MIRAHQVTDVLALFGLDADYCSVAVINHGLINHTWKVMAEESEFILQQINTRIFTKPEWIAENISRINAFLQQHHPHYLFVAPLPASDGSPYVKDGQNHYFRLFSYVINSHTINTVNSPQQAFEAAKQFGRFTNLLSRFDASQLYITLPHFHDLSLRYQQFVEAVQEANAIRLAEAEKWIDDIEQHKDIVDDYEAIKRDGTIPLRVCHHDTKISNVLFDDRDRGICVIDLDTVMPGYIISDVGDMLRTYLSPVDEEEKDFDKIVVRMDYFKAIIQGYKSEMSALTATEKSLLIYAGKFMMYMQALRFLTDFLKGDVYYPIQYPTHNLIRAGNQLTLLKRFEEAENELTDLL